MDSWLIIYCSLLIWLHLLYSHHLLFDFIWIRCNVVVSSHQCTALTCVLFHRIIDTVGILSYNDDEIQHAIDSSLISHIQVTGGEELRGSAVATSNRRAVTLFTTWNYWSELRNSRGVQLSGRIEFQRFESNTVDIAVIVRLSQPIAVIGRLVSSVQALAIILENMCS